MVGDERMGEVGGEVVCVWGGQGEGRGAREGGAWGGEGRGESGVRRGSSEAWTGAGQQAAAACPAHLGGEGGARGRRGDRCLREGEADIWHGAEAA
jgi:hypothetical protein